MKAFISFLKEHVGLLVGAAAGLVIGVLILTVGFFPVLFLLILVGLGALIGGTPAIRNSLRKWLTGLFSGSAGR